jgi:hypothetical protein
LGSSPYSWLRRLGSGSSGVVWAVERDGRQFAVKVLRAASGPAHREAIRRETRIGPLIADHEGIVAVRHVEEIGDVMHLEMDLVRGPSLAQVLKGRLDERRGPLPAAVVVPWMVQVLDALDWAAARIAPDKPASFVHRDIKPANLLLDPSGRVRVTDFGIARAEAELGFQTTQTGVVKGSPRFMAPEVILEKAPDGRADQFSVGVALFELLTGVPLYQGRDLPETILLAVAADVEKRLQIVRAPPELLVVLRRMLQKSPSDRYPDHRAAILALLSVPLTGPTVDELLPELLGYGSDADDVGVDETGEVTAPVIEESVAQTDPGLVPRGNATMSFLGPPGETVQGTLHRTALATFVPLDDAPTKPGTFDELTSRNAFDEMDAFADADATTDVSGMLDEATPPVQRTSLSSLPSSSDVGRIVAANPQPAPPPPPRLLPGTLDQQLAALDRKEASEAPTQVLEREQIHAEIRRQLEQAPLPAAPAPAAEVTPTPVRPLEPTPLPTDPGSSVTATGWVRQGDEPWLLVLALLAVVFGLVGVVGVAVLAVWLNQGG